MNKYSSNSSKGCVIEADLEYPEELPELRNDYSLALNKIEIKREMLPEYQLTITDLYNISNGNVKRIVPNFFDNKKYLRLGLKLKNTSFIRIQSITMVKTIYRVQHTEE